MTLENVTKEEWDKMFKEVIQTTEEELKTYMTLYTELITLRSNYRKDYKNNRITHQLDFDEGTITYKLGTKRRIGYKLKGQKK